MTANKKLEKKYFPVDRVDADPFKEFSTWFKLAETHGNLDIDAMSLATATSEGKPSVRIVLFKGFLEGGFSFYTNYESQKGQELEENPQAALAFYWPLIYRQVRVEGVVSKLTHEQSEKYFHSRARGSQLAAATSHQSETIASLEDLHAEYAKTEEKFKGSDVPLPSYWGGYKLIPSRFEFWLGQDHRLHHRFNYLRGEDGLWKQDYLSP